MLLFITTETIFSLFPFRFVWLPVFLALARLALVATADDLGAPAIELVQEHLKDKPGHGADPVPDDERWDVLLAHAVGRLVVLTAPSQEAVAGLGFGSSGSHFFGKGVSWGVNTTGSVARKSSIALVVFPLSRPPLR